MSVDAPARPLLRPAEVADLLRLTSKRSVYYLARPGGPLAPARVQIAGHIRFNRVVLEKIIAGGMKAV